MIGAISQTLTEKSFCFSSSEELELDSQTSAYFGFSAKLLFGLGEHSLCAAKLDQNFPYSKIKTLFSIICFTLFKSKAGKSETAGE